MTGKELAEMWEPLAAEAPELRPENLVFDGHNWTMNPRMRDALIHSKEAAALWRDSAVRWLVDNAPSHALVITTNPDGYRAYAGPGHPDIDRALAFAVRTRIDARKAVSA